MDSSTHSILLFVDWIAGTTVCYSSNVTDADSWYRNQETHYTDGQLCWEHVHIKSGSVFFSYFPPFSYSRHLGLVSRCSQLATVESLGQSLDGREIECIIHGSGKTVCWIIHRQHPGESMAEHFAEGLLTRVLGLDASGKTDDLVKQLLTKYTFYIVPCMCVDGVVRGHLRTNGCGANLNREWATKRFYKAPTLERSPEVYAVLQKMDETGVDLFLDVHGDEELPFNFISGAEKTPNWDKRMESLHGAFVAAFCRSSEDMQQKIGYPSPRTSADAEKYLNVATNQIATRFNCLAMTLEMPFKDCLTKRDPPRGWSPARSRALGASILSPIDYVHPYLRDKGEFWKNLPEEDAYVETSDDYEAELRAAQEFVPLMKSKRYYSDVHQNHPSKSAEA
jgi:murein tripeptide amidase MpaA